jgi:hypothetical protein
LERSEKENSEKERRKKRRKITEEDGSVSENQPSVSRLLLLSTKH